MVIVVENVASQAVIGGSDNLLDIDLAHEMRMYLRVKVQNAFRVSSYKARKWDGYRYFITEKGLKFATGFLPVLIPFLEELGVKITIDDRRTNLPYIRKEEMRDRLGDKVLRDIQRPLVACVDNYLKYGDGKELYFPRGLIDAATNTGKTLVMGLIYDNFEDCKVLIIVHRKEIFDQMVDYYGQYFDVGIISSGRYHVTDFTIAMVSSLASKLDSSLNVKHDMRRFNTLMVDEGHRAGGTEYSEVLKEIPAGARFIVSGTALENTDPIKNMIITAMSGRRLAKVTNKEMIEAGHSQAPVIHMKLNDVFVPNKCFNYDAEMEECIFRSEKRKQDIIDWIKEGPGKDVVTAIAFNELEHGTRLHWFLTKAFPELVVEIVHGKDPDRKEKLKSFKRKEIDVLVCSTIVQEGFDTDVIGSMVYAIAGKSSIRLKQFLGRGMRHDGISKEFHVLDWWDYGKYIGKHSGTRLKIYQTEGFEVKYYYPETKTGRPKNQLK